MNQFLEGEEIPITLDHLLWLVTVLVNFCDAEGSEPPQPLGPALYDSWRQRWEAAVGLAPSMLDVTPYARACKELSTALKELHRQAGRPSLDRIIAWGKEKMPCSSSMSKSTVSDVMAGKRAPASLDRLLWLVQALTNFRDGQEVAPPTRRDPALLAPWRRLWDSVEDGRAASRTGKTGPHPYDTQT
ncbi:hypothetical protein [Streptomyces sp. NPDC002580]|uniref:hypothetical protein n=1 Tax=Streptomyces sp. NPDC002580 TaxID=3364653 RepID=UPI00367DB5D2